MDQICATWYRRSVDQNIVVYSRFFFDPWTKKVHGLNSNFRTGPIGNQRLHRKAGTAAALHAAEDTLPVTSTKFLQEPL